MTTEHYPADETELTAEQVDALASAGTPVALAPPPFAWMPRATLITDTLNTSGITSVREVVIAGQLVTVTDGERDAALAAAG